MISFSANVKRELCRTAPGAKCCALAEMLGALLYANHFSASCIRIVTENPEFAARLPRLLQRGFGLRFDALPEPEAQGKRVLVLEDPEKISHVFTLCGFSAESSLALHVNLALLENDCCRRAFLRGAFLAGGSVTAPAKRYHQEFSTSHRRVCAETGTLLLEMGLTPKQTERKGSSILYFKQSETIEELLALMGAPVSAMTVMQAKIEKDWRNDANRKTNCDTANVTKAVDAAQEQLAALRTLEAQGRLDTLPEKLLQTALLRREHPEATLSELAELHEPPTSKSTVNHRMRKLLALAAEGTEPTEEGPACPPRFSEKGRLPHGIRTSSRPQRIQSARRRMPHRQACCARQRAGPDCAGHHRSRRHVRRDRLLSCCKGRGHQAHHRLRGLCRTAHHGRPRPRRGQ